MILRKSSLDIIYEYNSKYCVYKEAVEATFFKSLDAVSNPNLIKPVRADFMKIIAFFGNTLFFYSSLYYVRKCQILVQKIT